MKKFTLALSLFAFAGFAVKAQSQQAVNSIYGSRTQSVVQTSSPAPVAKGGTPSVMSMYSDNFDGDNTIAGLEARGYKTYYNGTGAPGVAAIWFQGNPANWNSYNGADTSYVSSNFNTLLNTGDIDNWLVTPIIANVAAGDEISFWSRSPAASPYPDSIAVMYSAVGDSTPTDPSWVMIGNFKVNTSGSWQKTTLAVTTPGATARFAIRYKVADGGPGGNNSDLIGIDQLDVYTPTPSVVPNDECLGAIDINSLFGQPVGVPQLSVPYDNTLATTSAQDPTSGYACFGEPTGNGASPSLENTMWYSFTGDGNQYYIETTDGPGITNYIDDGDTQIAIYTGACGALVPFDCNEDGPSALPNGPYPAGLTINTTVGQTYYMMIDGFAFNGTPSLGEYLIEVTRNMVIPCGDPSISFGTSSANVPYVCPGDTVVFTITGVTAPNVGDQYGLGWVVSTADISGNTDPLNDPSVFAGYVVQKPAPDSSTRSFINDGALIGGGTYPYGTYYWTPVVFGNGVVATPPGTFIWQLDLDPTCTYTGNSIMVDVFAANDPLCTVGINDPNQPIRISGVYPVPVTDLLNFNINTQGGLFDVTITDNLGRVVMKDQQQVVAGSQKLNYDVTSLNSGVYFINVNDGSNNAVSKFVKQ